MPDDRGHSEAAEVVPLRDLALGGASAVMADCVTIGIAAVIVLLCHWFAPGDSSPTLTLYIPLGALALGLLGAIFAGPNRAGMLRAPGYVLRFYLAIGILVGLDLIVRALLGGDLWMVFPNWAVLMGSASATNLLLTKLPVLSVASYIDDDEIAAFHPFAMFIAILLQVAQGGISLLGAGWFVVLVQIVVRRVAILPITHLLSHRSYGSAGAQRLRDNESIEYVATRAVADSEGRLVEPDPQAQAVVGTMLIKLPMFAGESMSAGRKSLTRLVDKLVFLEQMLAFSSPTMVVSRTCAIAHIAFLQTVTSFDGEPSLRNPSLANRELNVAKVSAAIRDDWTGFQ